MTKKEVSSPEVIAVHPVQAPSPTKPEKLSDIDKLTLDLAKQKRATALAEAKTAVSANDLAESQFKYVILSLYRKYNLNDEDGLAEDGSIVYNEAAQK